MEHPMGEPIKLYNRQGEEMVVNAPSYARQLVASGRWSTEKPEPVTEFEPQELVVEQAELAGPAQIVGQVDEPVVMDMTEKIGPATEKPRKPVGKPARKKAK